MSRILILVGISLWSMVTLAAPDLAKIKKQLQADFPVEIQAVRATPIVGLFEVIADGLVVYISEDGRHIVRGDIYERKSGRNITKLAIMDTISDDNTIVFAGKDPKYTITIFTDTSCGYCRKLHKEVPDLTKNGVKVRYMLFPRAGPDAASAQTMESVWCSDNSQQAMTLVKFGGTVPAKKCANPIEQHMSIANQLGVRGTPYIVTGRGTIIPGYKPADQLMAILQSEALQETAAK